MQWAAEREEVGRLLAANAEHPGLKSVLAHLTTWCEAACDNSRAFDGANEIARVIRHGVKPVAILTEAAAFTLWLGKHPHALPDLRSTDFALARAVFGLAPRERRQTRGPGGVWPVSSALVSNCSYSPKPRPSALAHVGSYLRATLAPFLANIASSVEAKAQAQAALAEAMKAPLRVL